LRTSPLPFPGGPSRKRGKKKDVDARQRPNEGGKVQKEKSWKGGDRRKNSLAGSIFLPGRKKTFGRRLGVGEEFGHPVDRKGKGRAHARAERGLALNNLHDKLAQTHIRKSRIDLGGVPSTLRKPTSCAVGRSQKRYGTRILPSFGTYEKREEKGSPIVRARSMKEGKVLLQGEVQELSPWGRPAW